MKKQLTEKVINTMKKNYIDLKSNSRYYTEYNFTETDAINLGEVFDYAKYLNKNDEVFSLDYLDNYLKNNALSRNEKNVICKKYKFNDIELIKRYSEYLELRRLLLCSDLSFDEKMNLIGYPELNQKVLYANRLYVVKDISKTKKRIIITNYKEDLKFSLRKNFKYVQTGYSSAYISLKY